MDVLIVAEDERDVVNEDSLKLDEVVALVREVILLVEVLPGEEVDVLVKEATAADVTELDLDVEVDMGVSKLDGNGDGAVRELPEEVEPVRDREEEGATKVEEGKILVEVDRWAHAVGLLLQRLAS